jgi:type I restriction enzyme R subunit
MSDMNEADTRAKLIDSAIHDRGWKEDFIKREESAGAVEIVAGKARRRSKGRMDYTLRVQVNPETQPVAMGLLEAKKESLAPGHGQDQAKGYARASQHNVQFVFSSNGHMFVEFDRSTGMTSSPRPLSEFPTPDELRARYERTMGFSLAAPAAKPLLQRYVAVYDLKAVNPNRKANVDTRTPDELLDLIEAKGRDIMDALALLRQNRTAAVRAKAAKT